MIDPPFLGCAGGTCGPISTTAVHFWAVGPEIAPAEWERSSLTSLGPRSVLLFCSGCGALWRRLMPPISETIPSEVPTSDDGEQHV